MPVSFSDVALKIFGKLFVARLRSRSGVDLEAAQALTVLVDAQTQATANGWLAPAFRFTGREIADLEDVGVVLTFLQGRVRENELQGDEKLSSFSLSRMIKL